MVRFTVFVIGTIYLSLTSTWKIYMKTQNNFPYTNQLIATTNLKITVNIWGTNQSGVCAPYRSTECINFPINLRFAQASDVEETCRRMCVQLHLQISQPYSLMHNKPTLKCDRYFPVSSYNSRAPQTSTVIWVIHLSKAGWTKLNCP